MSISESFPLLVAAFDEHYLAQFRWLKQASATHYSTWPSGKGREGNLDKHLRFQVYEQCQGKCYLCRLPVDVTHDNGPFMMTIDHIIPLCMDGIFASLANLALAHQWCNQQKGTAPFPRTLFIRDSLQCFRCEEHVSHNEKADDWQWNRPIIERLVPLKAVEIWDSDYAWTCHLRCHRFNVAPCNQQPNDVF